MPHAIHILCLGSLASGVGAQAMYLARRLGAILHVMPVPASGRASGADDTEIAHVPQREKESSRGDEAVSMRIVEAQPDSIAAVLRYVSATGIDLVVADIPPDRGPVPLLATDMPQALVRQLPRPIFIVEHEGDPGAIQRLFLPTDLSARTLQAFRYAVSLARLYDAAVDVLHVIESAPYVALTPMDRLSLGVMTLAECRARHRVHAFLQGEEPADVQVRSHILHGNAADQIGRFADRADADLMVLAVDGADAGRENPFGAVGARVLRQVTCPLVLVPEPEPSPLAPPGGAV